jgi:hypothetical protein
MLISQCHGDPSARQGCQAADLAELRRQLQQPSMIDDACRQRLVDLARRLARVRALGNEYHRVFFGEAAQEALASAPAD